MSGTSSNKYINGRNLNLKINKPIKKGNMILCSEECIPCCDYCLHVMTEHIPYNGKLVNGGPIGCFKHPDAEHNEIAKSCGYCEDFHCKNVKE